MMLPFVLNALFLLLASPRVYAGEPIIPPALAPLFRAENDRQLSRVFVPSPEEKVGEVRVLQRGDAAVVQTLLYSKLLKRVVGEIRKKELVNWPAGAEGHADAARYLEALEQAQQTIWSRMAKRERTADTRQKLLIEFALSSDAGAVLLAEYDMKESGNEVTVSERRPLSVLAPSRAYVQRNMRLIVADSFQLTEAELGKVLGGLSLFAVSGSSPAPPAPDCGAVSTANHNFLLPSDAKK